MKYSILTYLIGEGFSNVFKNKKQAFTSIGVMCITMIIFGVFFVIGENLNHFVKEIESQQGLQVYMDKDATEEQINKLNKELLAIDGINTVEYISQEDALQVMIDRFGEKGNLLKGYDVKVFPVSYIVTLTNLEATDQIKSEILKLDNVTDIGSSNETIHTLSKIAKGIRIGTYVILVCLIVFSVFIITNTIKLTVHARRREISIMKYVGATNGFIRWPFAVEGMLIGLIAGMSSIIILSGIYTVASNAEGFIKFLAKLNLTLLQFSDMLSLIIVVYLVLGIGVGVLGSTISMRKYLKV